MSTDEKPAALPRLKPQHALFVAAYLASFSPKQAATAAGYSPRTAGQTGLNLLKREDVQAHLKHRLAMKAAEFDITSTEVLGVLANVMRGNMADYLDLQGKVALPLAKNGEGLDRALMARVKKYRVDTVGMIGTGEAAVPIIRTTVELKDDLRAAELLCRNLGLFREQQPFNGDQRPDAAIGDGETMREVATKLVFALRLAMEQAAQEQSAPDEERPAKPLH